MQKRDGFQRIFPYHLNTKDNVDLIGQQLPVEEGAWCHYPDEVQQELELYSWANQTNGPWVVALGVGMMTHYTMAFCMQSLNATMPTDRTIRMVRWMGILT